MDSELTRQKSDFWKCDLGEGEKGLFCFVFFVFVCVFLKFFLCVFVVFVLVLFLLFFFNNDN